MSLRRLEKAAKLAKGSLANRVSAKQMVLLVMTGLSVMWRMYTYLTFVDGFIS